MNLLLKRFLPIAVVVALAAAGYVVYQKKAAAGPAQRYRFQALEQGDLTQSVSANGTLNPVVLVSVGTQVSGTVKKLHVDFNDRVRAGQVLAELDDAIYAAQVRQSDASVVSAAAVVDLARASEARQQSLFQQEYVARQDLDQAVQTRKSAEAQLKLARAQNDRDRANLGYSVIRSPVSGVVVDRQIDVGQTVAASFQTPTLFKIAQDLKDMQIYTTFAEADIGNIRDAQPVRFNVDAFPNRSFQGRVKQIRLNPTTQQNVVTYNVVIAVDNPEQVLLPGMTAYVNIAVANRKDVLRIPNAALRFKPAGEEKAAAPAQIANGGPRPAADAPAGDAAGRGGPPGAGGDKKRRRDTASGTAYILHEGKLKPVTLGIGITDSRFTEIVSGDLKAGDQVAVGEAVQNTETPSSSNFRLRMF